MVAWLPTVSNGTFTSIAAIRLRGRNLRAFLAYWIATIIFCEFRVPRRTETGRPTVQIVTRSEVMTYNLQTKKYEVITKGFASEPGPWWLSDSRRLLFGGAAGPQRGQTIYMVDTVPGGSVKFRRQIPLCCLNLGSVYNDNRQLFVTTVNFAADIDDQREMNRRQSAGKVGNPLDDILHQAPKSFESMTTTNHPKRYLALDFNLLRSARA